MSVQVQHRRDSNTNVEANTPAAGELWWDVTKNEMGIGNGALAGGIRMQKKNQREILLPAQITANTNDYNPTGLKHASVLVVTTDAARNLTGLVPNTVTDTTDGVERTIYNGGAFNLVVQDQNASSAAANRFDLGGADVTLAPKQTITLRYRTQGGLNRWEIKSRTDGQAVADGSITARKLATSGIAARAGMVNGTIACTNNGTVATYALKTMAGANPSAADPVYFVFQDGAGGLQIIAQTAAVSWGFSSGSTAGASNGVPFIIHHVVFNNAGVLGFGAVNCRLGNSVLSLNDYSTAAVTVAVAQEGGAGAADSAQVVYVQIGLGVGNYMCYLGRSNYEAGLAAAGTWNVNPTTTVIWTSGMARPGEVVATSNVESGAMLTDTSANMPGNSDVIPVNTNGSQAMTLTTEPCKSKANLFEIDFACAMLSSSVAGWSCIALFQDAVSAAIASVNCGHLDASARSNIGGRHRMVSGIAAGTTTTFKMRFGIGGAGTATFNGLGGGRFGGGVMPSQITAREIQG